MVTTTDDALGSVTRALTAKLQAARWTCRGERLYDEEGELVGALDGELVLELAGFFGVMARA